MSRGSSNLRQFPANICSFLQRSVALKCRGCWEIDFYQQYWIKILHPWVQEFYPVLGVCPLCCRNLCIASRLCMCGRGAGLRGPAAILFISRNTCSDSIAKLFRACFCVVSHNYRAIRCKMGYRTDVPVRNHVPRGGIAPFWGSANLPKKVSRDMGYRNDSIAISRDMGPLRSWGQQIQEFAERSWRKC